MIDLNIPGRQKFNQISYQISARLSRNVRKASCQRDWKTFLGNDSSGNVIRRRRQREFIECFHKEATQFDPIWIPNSADWPDFKQGIPLLKFKLLVTCSSDTILKTGDFKENFLIDQSQRLYIRDLNLNISPHWFMNESFQPPLNFGNHCLNPCKHTYVYTHFHLWFFSVRRHTKAVIKCVSFHFRSFGYVFVFEKRDYF